MMVELTDLPHISETQMILVDRLMEDVYGIQLIQMMENAGRLLAELSRRRFLGGDPLDKKIIILAGSGGNGGGAMVAARNLHNWGSQVRLFLTRDLEELKGTILHQAQLLNNIGVPVDSTGLPAEDLNPDLIIDGVIGYSLRGAPRGRAGELISWANQQPSSLLALDLPSGLDATSGETQTPCIEATATLTLALPKTGLLQPQQPVVGELYLADIGVPPELYAHPELNLAVGPIFQQEQIIRLI
jgi:NAD(P)H-hydrate epimerase